MENTKRDTILHATLQYNGQDMETNNLLVQDSEWCSLDPTRYIADDEEEISLYAMAITDKPDPNDEDDDDDDDDEDSDEGDEKDDENAEEGDWGHIDPVEGNSPFPSSNDPSGPGSAV